MLGLHPLQADRPQMLWSIARIKAASRMVSQGDQHPRTPAVTAASGPGRVPPESPSSVARGPCPSRLISRHSGIWSLLCLVWRQINLRTANTAGRLWLVRCLLPSERPKRNVRSLPGRLYVHQ